MLAKKNRNKQIIKIINTGMPTLILAKSLGLSRAALYAIYSRENDKAKRLKLRHCLVCKGKSDLISDSLFTICKSCAENVKNMLD